MSMQFGRSGTINITQHRKHAAQCPLSTNWLLKYCIQTSVFSLFCLSSVASELELKEAGKSPLWKACVLSFEIQNVHVGSVTFIYYLARIF